MKFNCTVILIFVLALTYDVSAHAVQSCSPDCGKTFGTGSCLSDGKCLCYWGFTGPSAKYKKHGSYMKIEANHCEWICSWTHDLQNAECVDEDVGGCSGSEDESSDAENDY
eukprot:Seg2175.6 transcript_id=Seg2175.6/GoldUCD/mRNA.D3Y31 product="hypothetical protein" protein_id=Seg2175.6/GoldUCD/D3Y31